MSTHRVILSLLSFASATEMYQNLSLSLTKSPLEKEIWAFETDRPALEDCLEIELSKIRFFPGLSALFSALQMAYDSGTVLLNPLGLIPIKTFLLPTISFVLPMETNRLWAPRQLFDTNEKWEGFADLILSSSLVVFCTDDKNADSVSLIDSFRDFLHHQHLTQGRQLIEWRGSLTPFSQNHLADWMSAIDFAGYELAESQLSALPPLVSIVTPSFNQGKFIERTIRSVLGQNYPNFEYLIVDGASSDETMRIVRKYGPRLDWISEPDKGYADAIRKGFLRAKGKYICWMPSDDEFFRPDSLTILVSRLESSMADVVFGNCVYIDDQSKWLDQYKTSQFSLDRLRNWCLIPQPSTLFRSEVYHRAGGVDAGLASVADYDLWVRIAENGGKFLRIGDTISKYRLHSDSITSSRNASTYAEVLRLQIRRYGRAFPGWVSGAVGEVVHHIKGKPIGVGVPGSTSKQKGRLRSFVRNDLVEELLNRIPLTQRLLASLLSAIRG